VASPAGNGFTRARLVALVVVGVLIVGLVYLSFASGDSVLSVPEGAQAGDLALEPCAYATEAGRLEADCGTLAVPENRSDPSSRLIALPVKRIRATGDDPGEPIFRLQGGPGISNMSFREASRLTERHDVVLVGYRGVEGSSVLDCPEVVSALRQSADFGGEESQRRYADAFAACSQRLLDDRIDLAGYSLPQRVDDLEAVRTALGYGRIDLVSESVGTRTAMIYSWRYPESVRRSVMIDVNPPGHYLWNPETTDEQLRYYAGLCRKDARCGARTDDLAASMRSTAADLPDRWLFLPIKAGNVKVATFFGLMETNEGAAPLNAPTTIDAWLSAADGDASGLWFQSFMADFAFPEAFVWGEFAATAMMDAGAADAYYAAGGDTGSILGNSATDFLWAKGMLTAAWPASPDNVGYQEVQTSPVETLLIGGTVDFSTPASFAADELLPHLSNGRQVILAEFGHSGDFWDYQPEASTRLLTRFFDSGEVDDSLYRPQSVDFDVGVPSHPTIAKILLGLMLGLAMSALVLLASMAIRVHRRGKLGSKTSAWLRTLSPLLLGLGGWFLALLIVLTAWPALFVGSELLAVLSMGIPIGLGAYLAWTHRDWSRATRYQGLAAAIAGALTGAWLGFNTTEGLLAVVTTLVGAAVAANLALIVLDIVWDRSERDRSRPHTRTVESTGS
jgi:pimeloyl-ACP methyl ester carboxylesterase